MRKLWLRLLCRLKGHRWTLVQKFETHDLHRCRRCDRLNWLLNVNGFGVLLKERGLFTSMLAQFKQEYPLLKLMKEKASPGGRSFEIPLGPK